MNPIDLVRLRPLMDITNGNKDISIGVIDGPVDFKHNALRDSKIKTISESYLNYCKKSDSIACRHGTFVLGILAASRDSYAPAICPQCQIILRPIFVDSENINNGSSNIALPTSNPKELANAIIEVAKAGARIINLSIGISSSSIKKYDELQEAYDYCLRKDIIIIAATGNQGSLGYTSNFHHPWIIPVVACNENGQFDSMSNFGPSIGKRGLMAPGINITSLMAGGEYIKMSGTSFASPIVTGTIALLWSLFPRAKAEHIIHAIKSHIYNKKKFSIIPSLLNAEHALDILRR